MGAPCFLCDRKLCPECCPEINEAEGYNVTLFPICSVCAHRSSDRQRKTPIIINDTSEKDRDMENEKDKKEGSNEQESNGKDEAKTDENT